MKVKKVLFYAAPVALAGFLYIGEATGIGEVLAKTVKTVIQMETVGEYIGSESTSTNNSEEYKDDNYIYKLRSVNESAYVYDKYQIIKTDIVTETEVPDDPQSSDVSVKVVPTVDPEAEKAEAEKRRQEAAVKVQKEAEQKTEDFINEISKITEQAIQAAMKSASGKHLFYLVHIPLSPWIVVLF